MRDSSAPLSLTDINLERIRVRSWSEFWRDPDWLADAFAGQLPVELLPVLEQDIVTLYYQHEKRQECVARILGISQRAVSYRLRQALRRLAFFLAHPKITADQIRADLAPLLPAVTVDVLVEFADTSSVVLTARRLGLSVPAVWAAIEGALCWLAGPVTLDAIFYSDYFERLLSNPHIYREGTGRPRRRGDVRESQQIERYVECLEGTASRTDRRPPRPRPAGVVAGRRGPAEIAGRPVAVCA